jgi:hypothetical protein
MLHFWIPCAESRPPVFRTEALLTGMGLSLSLMTILGTIPSAFADSARPANLTEIEAPKPLEISGVAAVPGGYAVVGDDTGDHGRIWPGGDTWLIAPPLEGPESLDVGTSPLGETLWLVLDENTRTLADMDGGRYQFPNRFKEVCGRGLEGLALRWNGGWEVAAVWEGGFYEPDCEAPADFARPRVVIFRWQRGQGTQGPDREFDLDVPRLDDKERFRAPDLTWDGNNLLVLLSSQSKKNKRFSHTWLQAFDIDGKPVGNPFKLEKEWGEYRDKKNWEALDWTIDGSHLVMGFDAKKGRRVLAVFPYP